MKIRALICTASLALLFLVLAPVSNAKETIVFESALKDAVFIPLYISERTTEPMFPAAGWWTLKFENGAVITSYRISGDPIRDFSIIKIYKKAGIKLPDPGLDIWWIGKVYIVSKDEDRPELFIVKLKEEPAADLDQTLTKRKGPKQA
jgi:hypothetical protein